MTKTLTLKQENFCQAYIRLGDKSAAYREAYSCKGMKPASINNKAYELFKKVEITARIDRLKQETADRNKITVDELVSILAEMARFDIGDLYDDSGNLLPIKQMPKAARLMIQQIESEELKFGIDSPMIGQSRKVKITDKQNAIEKLMKHLGGYEKDNKQKAPVVKTTIQWGGREIKI